jgi:hypothetical protein
MSLRLRYRPVTIPLPRYLDRPSATDTLPIPYRYLPLLTVTYRYRPLLTITDRY